MASYKLDDNAVQNVIDHAQDWAKNALSKSAVDVLVLREAWLALKDQRKDPQLSNSLELAAAEHYMYAAFAAAHSGDPVMQLAPSVYAAKKKLYFFFGWETRMRTDPKFPALAPNEGVVDWGIEGARYGLEIYKKQNPGQQFHYGASIEHLMNDAGYSDRASSLGGDAAKKFGSMIASYI